MIYDHVSINSVTMGGEIVLCFEFKTSKPIRDVGVGFGIETPQQMRLVSFNNYILNKEEVSVSGVAIARCRIPQIMLLPGKYYCSFSVVQGQREWVDYVERATVFDVLAIDVHGTGRTLQPGQG